MELTRRTAFRTFQIPKIEWSWIPLSLLVGLLIVLLAYPLALLLIKSFVVSRPGQDNVWAINGWVEAFTDANLAVAIGNTFYLAFLRVVITTVLAIFFAWVVTRTDTPLKGVIEVTLWLGFFLPLLPMTMGWILLATLLFFSSLAFTALENAMSVIFFHRVRIQRRHFLVSAVLPYLFILFLTVGLVVVTVATRRRLVMLGLLPCTASQ